MKTTEEYFNLTVNELISTNESEYTKEENKLFDEGESVTFFDDEEDYREEMESFTNWYVACGYDIKEELITVNGRIAVILV